MLTSHIKRTFFQNIGVQRAAVISADIRWVAIPLASRGTKAPEPHLGNPPQHSSKVEIGYRNKISCRYRHRPPPKLGLLLANTKDTAGKRLIVSR